MGVDTVTHKELNAAFDEIVEKEGKKDFIEKYFGGKKRVNTMKAALKSMREATDNHVAILSASWGVSPKRPWLKAPIPAEEWAAYLLHLTGFVGLGFDADHIIGVYAPGPPIIPEKGEALEEYYKKMYGTTPANVVHIDKFKYASRILAVGGNLLQPDPLYVQQFNLNEMIIKAGGSQVGYWDILKQALFGKQRAEALAFTAPPAAAETVNLPVLALAALGLGAVLYGSYKFYCTKNTAEAMPLSQEV